LVTCQPKNLEIIVVFKFLLRIPYVVRRI